MFHSNWILLVTFVSLINVITCTLDPSALRPMKGSITTPPTSGLFGFTLPSLPSFKLFSGVPCISKSLQPGTCELPSDCATNSGFDSGKSLCPAEKVCCVQSKTCGEVSILNNTLFSNPSYPSATREDGQCIYTVKILPLVEALRIDFVDMILHEPDHTTGECDTDAFWLEGVGREFHLGKLCGHLSGSHIYIPVDKELFGKPITLHVALSKDAFDRRWLIRVDQLKDKLAEIPPDYCLQYYTGESGVISSFNFNLENQTGYGNIDKLKYSICIRQEEGFCKLEFESPFFSMAPHYRPVSVPMHPNPFRYPLDSSKSGDLKQHYYLLRNSQSKSAMRLDTAAFHRYPSSGQFVNYPLLVNGQPRPIFSCFNRDTLTFPPTDDGVEPVHCSNLFHPTKTATTSSPPYILMVNNKGTSHGKGFLLKYKQLVC